MTTLAFQSRIYHCLHNGLNLKLLLEATGLDRNTFAQYLTDNLFNAEQEKALKVVMKEWEEGR